MSIIAAAGDLLLGASCPGCEQPGWGLCPPCQVELSTMRAMTFDVDGVPGTAAGEYSGVFRSCLVAYKERRAWGLSRPLGVALAWAAAGLMGGDEAVQLVAVPSLPAAVRARGEDVTHRMAREAALRLRSIGVDVAAVRGLRLARRVADQSGLDAVARQRNLAYSMRAAHGGGAVIVVDDIVTTGATLREAVRAFRAVGRPVLGAAVVAATPRRHP